MPRLTSSLLPGSAQGVRPRLPQSLPNQPHPALVPLWLAHGALLPALPKIRAHRGRRQRQACHHVAAQGAPDQAIEGGGGSRGAADARDVRADVRDGGRSRRIVCLVCTADRPSQLRASCRTSPLTPHGPLPSALPAPRLASPPAAASHHLAPPSGLVSAPAQLPASPHTHAPTSPPLCGRHG